MLLRQFRPGGGVLEELGGLRVVPHPQAGLQAAGRAPSQGLRCEVPSLGLPELGGDGAPQGCSPRRRFWGHRWGGGAGVNPCAHPGPHITAKMMSSHIV